MQIGGYPARKVIRCLVCHFGLSACAGWLAYWLILTTGADVGGDGISWQALVVALCCAVLSHVVEDYTINRF